MAEVSAFCCFLLGRPTHPVPSQPDPQHFPDLDHRHLPVDHPPPPRRTVWRTGSGPRAPPPHDAPGGPMTGNRVVPCLWQNRRGQSGPLVVAGDKSGPRGRVPGRQRSISSTRPRRLRGVSARVHCVRGTETLRRLGHKRIPSFHSPSPRDPASLCYLPASRHYGAAPSRKCCNTR